MSWEDIKIEPYMNSINEIKVKKLHKDAQIPKYMTLGSACFDLHALIESDDGLEVVKEGHPVIFRTGLAFEIPNGYVMLIFSRSSMGFKNNLRLANCVGVIDSDYRGEVMVKLTYDGFNPDGIGIVNGERIAQCMLVKLPLLTITEVEELSDTERGTGGFGSTGKL